MSNINVFTGPMKCGKTQKIFDEFARQQIAEKNIKVFSPSMDTRFGVSNIKSRNRDKIKAIGINSINEIENYEADTYFIDEFQFLKGDINVIEKMASKGKKFFIAGLNLTAEKKPFGKMGDLLCIADNIHILTSICDNCKNDNAIYTFYKGKKEGDILIGDSEYLAVCRNCYDKLMKEYGNS